MVAVRFRASGRSKAYHFDPAGERFAVGDRVIVATSRGDEFGEVTTANTRLRTSALVLPLKRVLRRATKEDEERYERVLSREGEVLRESAPLFERHDPPMKLVDVEYTFDSSKLFFYFMADGRVDFRELVRQLGGKYHCRIELRQVGERDRAKEMGGIGMCGRPLCCHTFLHDFTQVSIKIAKEQSLALATSKISGACGKLMCCLRFEYDTYVEENKRTPRVGSVVHTRDGNGTVIEARPLVGMVKVRPLDAPDADARVYPREEVFPGLGEFPPQATKPSQATRPPQPSSPSRRAPRGEGGDRLPAARAAGSESEPNRLSPDGDEGENLAASRGGPEEVASLATGRGSRGRGSVHRAPRRPSQGAVDEGAAPAPSESKRLSRARRGARQPGAQITPDKIEQSEPRSARGAGGAQGEGIKPSREGGRPSETKRAAGRARANRPAAGGASGISRAAGERAGKGYTVSRAGGADDNRASAGERSSGKGYTVLQKGGKPPREGE